MALNNFIPQIWAAQILVNLHKAHVYAAPEVVNRDYEGDIRMQGDTVKINAIGRPTIGKYAKDTNIGDPENLNAAQTVLLIDQGDYFNFQVDDIDRVQGNPAVMGAAMQEAAYGLADSVDQCVAGLYTGAAAANYVGTDASPKTPTASAADAYGLIVLANQRMDEANIPKGARWGIVPPWFYALLLQDSRFILAYAAGTTEGLRNGDVGRIIGTTIYASNNVPISAASGGGHYKLTFGYPGAISYADQIVEVEAYRPQQRFGDAVKGLHVYGCKLVRPTGLVVVTADQPS